MKKLLITGLMAIIAFAGVATTVFAAPEVEQPRIVAGLHYTEASATAIPKEEAQQIGLNALTQFFGINFDQLGNYHVEMGYNPAFDPRAMPMSAIVYQFDGADGRIPVENNEVPDFIWPANVYRSTWHGTITVPNNRTPNSSGLMLRSNDIFRFTLDAQTGKLVRLQFFPSADPIARPNLQNECMGSPITAIEYSYNMTAQHNIEYANFAMQLAKDANIFESDVLRAALIGRGWMMGRNNSFELVAIVALESTTGETATFTLQGRNRKELVGVDFYSHMIDYAVDRDGNITEPTSQFVGNPQISNWIYR